MDQGLSFIINDEKLYAEQVLIEFEEMPVLFVCKGTHYYLALCTDPDIPAYYVTRSSVFSLLDMLQGKKSMRDTFLLSEEFWEIKAGDRVEQDIVIPRKKAEMDMSVLPIEGAVYESPSLEINDYIGRISRACMEEFALSIEHLNHSVNVVKSGEAMLSALASYVLETAKYDLIFENIANTLAEVTLAAKTAYELQVNDDSDDTYPLAA